MNTWVSKDNTVHHYHTGHRSICNLSDILQDVAKTHNTAECPNVKCKVCVRILTSKGFFKINQEKNQNMIKEAQFLQKYKTSPVYMLMQYVASPENRTTTLKKIRSDLAGQFDGININDILAEAIIRGKITHDNGVNFYAKCNGEIIL